MEQRVSAGREVEVPVVAVRANVFVLRLSVRTDFGIVAPKSGRNPVVGYRVVVGKDDAPHVTSARYSVVFPRIRIGYATYTSGGENLG